MHIRDRIKDLRRVRAGDLRPHPKNWRKHPEQQQNALRGILAEVGFVDALMVRELPDGGLQIVDGHLRAETTPDAEVPVLVVDLDEAEADKVLATFDPLAAMAEPDEAQLEALLKGISTDSDAVRRWRSRRTTCRSRPTRRSPSSVTFGSWANIDCSAATAVSPRMSTGCSAAR
jgi:ParB-like chromosome segregation protein Spo0J